MKHRARQMFRAAGRANFAGPMLIGYFAADLTSGDSLAAIIGRFAFLIVLCVALYAAIREERRMAALQEVADAQMAAAMAARKADAAVMVSPPIELEPGYFEFRVNWSGTDLMEMTGAQLDKLKAAIAAFAALDTEIQDAQDAALTANSPRRERVLVGQGDDTSDPLCQRARGHDGPCRPALSRNAAG